MTNIKDEWIKRGDDVAQFPVIVVYKDKTVFPASWYYKSLPEAKADTRPIDNIMVRKWNEDGTEVARKINRE